MHTPARVLVIEPDESIGQQLAAWLREGGYQPRFCPGPAAPRYGCPLAGGSTRGLIHDADAIVMDLRPDYDDASQESSAIEVLSESIFSGTPVVVLRRGGDPVQFEEGRSIRWPPRREELVRSIEHLLGAKRQGRTGIVMSVDTNRQTLEKMVAHHRTMVAELAERVARLADAPESGSRRQASQAVCSYLESDLLPHARAEEMTVYPAAAAAGLSRLVDEMVAEHRRLEAEVARLATTDSPDDALATARRIASLFATHAEKENTSILPPLAADPHIDLEALLGHMESVLAS